MLEFNIIKNKFTVSDTVIFTGNGNLDFSKRVASYFPGCLSESIPERFSDGEIRIPYIKENCRRKNCVIIQCCNYHPRYSLNDLIMEVFILIDMVKRSNAKSITVVMPIFPYQRQDRKSYSRSPISSSMIASILENFDIDRVICFELHAGQIQGFFHKVPIDNLTLNVYFKECIKDISKKLKIDTKEFIIVSPDEGGVKRASKLAKLINCPIALLHKERSNVNEIGEMVLMGHVENKYCIIIDDMIDTGGTVIKACSVLKQHKAKHISIMACHGILSGNALQNFENAIYCDDVYISNSIDVESRLTSDILKKKINIFDISELCAAVIHKGLQGESVSELLVSP